jgi:hypothetical protein
MEERVIGMLEDTSFQKAVTNKVFMSKILIEDKVMSMPSMAAAWALGGPQGFGALIDYFSQAPTEASQEVLAAMSPRVRDAFMLRKIGATVVMEQYGNMGTGVKPETKEQKDAMRVAAALAMATDGIDESVRSKALQELRDLGEDFELSAFGSKKVAKATKNSLVLTAAFLNLQETTSTGLQAEYKQLTQAGKTTHLSMQGGKLVFDFAANVEGKTTGTVPGVTDTSEELGFLARFNRMNSISLLHSQSGTLPKSRYTNPLDYFNTIVGDSDKDAPKAPVITQRTVGRLPDGTLGFVGE